MHGYDEAKRGLLVALTCIVKPNLTFSNTFFIMGRKLGKPLSPVLTRVFEALKVNDLNGLSEALDQPITTVRNWHTRESVPVEVLLAVANRTGVTVDWLLQGDVNKPNTIFFDRSPLLVKKSDAPTHLVAEAAPPPLYRQAEHGLWMMVITAVLRQLKQSGQELAPEKAAEVIVLIYEDIAETEADGLTEQQVERKTSRLMRLTA